MDIPAATTVANTFAAMSYHRYCLLHCCCAITDATLWSPSATNTTIPPPSHCLVPLPLLLLLWCCSFYQYLLSTLPPSKLQCIWSDLWRHHAAVATTVSLLWSWLPLLPMKLLLCYHRSCITYTYPTVPSVDVHHVVVIHTIPPTYCTVSIA